MQQILQNLKTGQTEFTDIPCPLPKPAHLLIHTRATLISAGTERMLQEFGQANFLDKARQQPDKVRQVLTKIKTDGLLPTISFTDGSIGTIHYFANGTKSFPKERLEVFCGEKILQLDNYKVLQGYGWKGFKDMRLWRQDKGHATEVADFIKAVKKGGPSPIPVEEIFEVFRTTIELATPVR